ncbi:MAG: hypothetical protein ABIL49_07535 [candidate division WOR-3 bacterium]
MLWIVILQSEQVRILTGPKGEIKEEPVNVWRYPQNRNYEVENIEWSYTPNASEIVFGIPQHVKGICPSAYKYVNNILLRPDEICGFAYVSDIRDFPQNNLRFYVKGKGRFRICADSRKGFVGCKEIELTDDWQEVIFDFQKAVIVAQYPRGKLGISFTPYTTDFEIYISKFILY